jgi:hypothetical protein
MAEDEKPKLVLASFPRSGNTYLRNILMDVFGMYSWNNIVVYNNALKEYKKLKRAKKIRTISAAGERKLRKLEKQLAFPMVKTHEMPKNILPLCNPDTKIIYLVRDGRDALVSMAHHRKDIIEPGSDFIHNLKEALWAPMGSYFGGWGANVEEWSKIAHLTLKFEEMTTDPETAIKKLQEVLDLPEPDMSKIPTFDSQRKGESHFGGTKRKNLSKEEKEEFNQKFFRSGKSGGWKNEMPEDLQKIFWEKHGKTMKKTGYNKDGSIKRS